MNPTIQAIWGLTWTLFLYLAAIIPSKTIEAPQVLGTSLTFKCKMG